MSKQEKVMCFPANILDEVGLPKGWSSDLKTYYLNLINENNLVFVSRDQAENDESFKQIIPYQILRFQDSVFVYRRGKKGGENRLHAKLSIGIGGHINDTDVENKDLGLITYATGAARELDEEVRIECDYNSYTSGVLYDDSNSVGRVHFGIVHVFELEEKFVYVKDEALDFIGWLTKEEIFDRFDEFETWSQITIENLLK